jgi:hypothetical protein
MGSCATMVWTSNRPIGPIWALYGVTGLPQDRAKFKTPTLRNVALIGSLHARRSLPDLGGGHRTLQQWGQGIIHRGPEHEVHPPVGSQLTPEKKAQLVAFLQHPYRLGFREQPRVPRSGASYVGLIPVQGAGRAAVSPRAVLHVGVRPFVKGPCGMSSVTATGLPAVGRLSTAVRHAASTTAMSGTQS